MNLMKSNVADADGHESSTGYRLNLSTLEGIAWHVLRLWTRIESPLLMLMVGDALKKCLRCLFLIIVICSPAFGKIKNGYEMNISQTRESLVYLQNLLAEKTDLSSFQRRKVESAIQELVHHVAYFELTENLLTQFKIVAPDIFSEIDTITDRLSRPVDVYVKFVRPDATAVKAWGITYVNQMENDRDAYVSEYGPFTVSINVWIVPRALEVLSHEFGHVKYQVPNLASYLEFHRAYYQDSHLLTFIGHSPDDPSGKNANLFGQLFRKKYVSFLKTRDQKA